MDNGGINIAYFKVIGLWQFLFPTQKSKIFTGFSFFCGSVFTLYITYQMVDNLFSNYEFAIFTEKLSVNLTCLESAIKILYYCSQRSSLVVLTKCFERKLLLCSSHDDTSTENILSKNIRFVNRVIKSFVFMMFTTVAIWCLLPILKWYSGDASLKIMPSNYPFRRDYFPINFLVYCLEFNTMVYCAALLYTVNCLFSAFALSIGAQFDLLMNSFSSVENNAKQRTKTISEKEEVMYLLLRECLIDHQNLLKLTKELEKMYNPMFLFQMLTSTFTICLVLVQLNEHLASSNELSIPLACKFIMYLVFGSMELFVYSWGGQIIYDKTGDVHQSVYRTGWERASAKYRRCILLAMLRSSKPDSLSAGKFYRVDLSSFTQVIKASYSYFTFLHGSDSKTR